MKKLINWVLFLLSITLVVLVVKLNPPEPVKFLHHKEHLFFTVDALDTTFTVGDYLAFYAYGPICKKKRTNQNNSHSFRV